MDRSIVPGGGDGGLRSTSQGFMVPNNSNSWGVVYYLAGAPIDLTEILVALALTPTQVCLCGTSGVIWGLTLSNIEDIRSTKIESYTITLNTPNGPTQMIPPKQMALEIAYVAEYMQGRLVLGMLTPNAASKWLNDINRAKWSFLGGLDDMGHHRE